MPALLVEVDLRPGVRALASALSVLHARGADLTGLAYVAGEGGAALDVHVAAEPAETQLLARQLERRVDVLAVRVPLTCYACRSRLPAVRRMSGADGHPVDLRSER